MPRLIAWGAGALGGAALLSALAALPGAQPTAVPEIVATGVSRPLQLVLDGRALVVLSPGARGDVACEVHRVALTGELPVDLSRQPRVRIPFADARLATLGSLALDPLTRELFLGEENGSRIYRLSADERLTVYATGLQRLAGGGVLAFDRTGRLLVVDYVDPRLAPGEDRGPPGLESLREEDYYGPLLFRLALEADVALPRRLDRVVPLFPRGWGGRRGSGLLPRFISVAEAAGGTIALLSSSGEVFRLGSDGALLSLARLPPGHGQYNRTHMVPAADGSLFVSGGFHVGRVFRVAADGAVTTVAGNLGDPEGIALDPAGYLYVAESAFHRIVRLKL